MQHMREVEAGLIPADSPPDFVRSDWKPGPGGLPGWFGPDYHPTPEAIAAFAEPPGPPASAVDDIIGRARR